MQFSYSISHVLGKQFIIPDLLSRQPVNHELTREEKELSLDTENYVDSIFRQLPATDMRLQEIKEKQGRDPVCQTLIRYCQVGWPETKSRACETGKIYWPYQGEISVNKGILMKGDRLIIPMEMRADILSKLHGAHQGITKCRL